MDLGTTAAVVGIIAAGVYVAETAHKYVSAFLKKIDRTRDRKIDRPCKKDLRTLMLSGVEKISLWDPDPISPSNLNRYLACPR